MHANPEQRRYTTITPINHIPYTLLEGGASSRCTAAELTNGTGLRAAPVPPLVPPQFSSAQFNSWQMYSEGVKV
uniref:Uncharacterized protein n=1 Tax=Anguilla anguilla TaxID=7936 RepID=A0A0E9VNF4_ANGAN